MKQPPVVLSGGVAVALPLQPSTAATAMTPIKVDFMVPSAGAPEVTRRPRCHLHYPQMG